MEKIIIRVGLLAILCTILSCSSNVETPVEPPPITPGKNYELLLFSSPQCIECPSELKGLDALYASEDPALKKRLKIKMYVQTGPNGEPPTAETATAYRDSVPVSFDARPDPWRWKTYRKHILTGWSLPAVVVLEEDGLKKNVYVGRKYSPNEVFDYVHELMSR